MKDDHLVALGRVSDAYGVMGWVKIEPYGDVQASASGSALLSSKQWSMYRAGSPSAPAVDCMLQIEHSKRHSNTIVAKPVDCEDRGAALAWRGAEVRVRRADFPKPAKDEFYWVDLVGCAVLDPQGTALGVVVSVDDHGAHPILALDSGVLIPFVDAYVLEVDLANRRIVADWRADWSE